MGVLTRLNIVTRGLEKGGYTSVVLEANHFLNAWLRHFYSSNGSRARRC